MSDLVYPTLDLFLYDLKEALNATDEVTRNNQEIFTKKLPKDVQIIDKDSETEYSELISSSTKDFEPDQELEGYYYPVRLNDTYGLQINCSVKNKNEPQSVEEFSHLKSEIEQRLNKQPITLGLAWILSGCIAENSNQDPKEIAQDCYKYFSPNRHWQRDFQGEDTFCGGKIFQLWQPQDSFYNIVDESNNLYLENTPVLIAIYPNLESAQKAANFYQDWMGLFSYVSKFNWAYAQSRLIKKNIFGYYKKVESDRQKSNDRNPQLNAHQLTASKQSLDNIQQDIKQYSSDLLGLAFQKQIIDINLTNYQTRLEFIRQKLDADNDNQLKFLNEFVNLVNKKYLVQIDKDSENMELAFKLLEDNINAVRSRIELAKAERDRNFQEFVAVVGAGIAGVSFAPADKNCEPIFGKPSLFCKTPVLFSLLVFIIVAGFTWLIRRKWK